MCRLQGEPDLKATLMEVQFFIGFSLDNFQSYKGIRVLEMFHDVSFPGCWIAGVSLIVDPGEMQRWGCCYTVGRSQIFSMTVSNIGELNTTKNFLSRLPKNPSLTNAKTIPLHISSTE